jgi:hypothetical protein
VKQGGLGLSLQKLEKRAMQRNMKERMEWIDRIKTHKATKSNAHLPALFH